MREKYQVVIVGGGMVGASMAAALADAPLEVLLLDAAEHIPDIITADYDIRVSAITTASLRFFQSLGIWDDLQASRITAFDQMHVWEKQSGAEIHFDGAEVGEAALGYIIENRLIQHFLLNKVQQSDNIDFIDKVRLESFQTIDNEQIELQLDNGHSYRCDLLIGADGSHSKVRSLAGIETKGWQYDQSAIVANVHTELPHQHTAWQCFLEDGPLAFLPLNDQHCSIVWSCQSEHAEALMQLPEQAFEQQLAQAFDHRLGEVKLNSARGIFPLQLQYINQYVKPGVALIGDAAHSIHPLAGQGVNLGLLDAACLVDVILEGIAAHHAPGSYKQLRRYERWRKGDNLGMMFVMDAFKKLFTTRSAPLQFIRNSGIKMTNSINPLKKAIMQSAAGMRGELPSMIRDVKHL